jgi:DnaK suppressor protein
MLTAEQFMNFKQLFEIEMRNLVYTQTLMNENFHVHQDDLLDSMDLTSSELETSMRMRLRNRETLYAKKIQEALRRIEDGTFGECQDCGEAIEMKRLQARPTATLCVSCKEEQEQKELHHIDGHIPKSLGAKLRFA